MLEGFSHLLTVILFLITLLRICRVQIQGTYKEMERSATKRVYKKAYVSIRQANFKKIV